jgi:hypothetical protein
LPQNHPLVSVITPVIREYREDIMDSEERHIMHLNDWTDEFDGAWDQALREQAINSVILDDRGHAWLLGVLEADRVERKERREE